MHAAVKVKISVAVPNVTPPTHCQLWSLGGCGCGCVDINLIQLQSTQTHYNLFKRSDIDLTKFTAENSVDYAINCCLISFHLVKIINW